VMKESNNVVVKVKYQGLNQPDRENPRPEMVTEWYVGRIVVVIVSILLLIGGLIYFFNRDPSPEVVIPENKAVDAMVSQKNKEPVKAIVKLPVLNIKKQEVMTSLTPLPPIINNKKVDKVLDIKPKVIMHKHVARALLVSGVNNKEPGTEILLPVVVNNMKASGVYYFTEIINMKGKTLYHQWLRDNQLVYERKIKILGKRWRASTSKLIPYSKAGKWRVRLVNKQGEVLNEIEFKVVKE